MDPETYLGEGIYASFDGLQFRLRAERADRRDPGFDELYIGGLTLQAFLEFLIAQGIPIQMP